MQSVDNRTYKKYFAPRREKSRWSEKNKILIADLEKRGLMTNFGRKKIATAKKDGSWDTPDLMKLTSEQVEVLSNLLESYETAYTNYQNMPPSRAYYDAKTDAGREKTPRMDS